MVEKDVTNLSSRVMVEKDVTNLSSRVMVEKDVTNLSSRVMVEKDFTSAAGLHSPFLSLAQTWCLWWRRSSPGSPWWQTGGSRCTD